MLVDYSAEPKELNQFVLDIAAEHKTGEVRIRLQPTIYRDGQYKPWPGITWMLSAESAEEAIQVKEMLRACFAAVGRLDGPTPVLEALEKL